jgi:hypothetical protein
MLPSEWPHASLQGAGCSGECCAMWTLFAIAAVVLIMAGVVAWYDARRVINEEHTRLRLADPKDH